MDQVRTGAFIQQTRKEMGMTQKELAEKLHISDKTISKWETGKGLPDVSLLPLVCETLHININEFLAGEKLPPNELAKKAEDNTLSLLRENYESKKRNIVSIIIGACLLFFGLVTMFCWGTLRIAQYIDVPTFWICLCLNGAIVLLSGKRSKKEIIHLLKGIVIPVGISVCITAIISVMGALDDPKLIGRELAISTLAILYSLVTYIILIVIEQKIK